MTHEHQANLAKGSKQLLCRVSHTTAVGQYGTRHMTRHKHNKLGKGQSPYCRQHREDASMPSHQQISHDNSLLDCCPTDSITDRACCLCSPQNHVTSQVDAQSGQRKGSCHNPFGEPAASATSSNHRRISKAHATLSMPGKLCFIAITQAGHTCTQQKEHRQGCDCLPARSKHMYRGKPSPWQWQRNGCSLAEQAPPNQSDRLFQQMV